MSWLRARAEGPEESFDVLLQLMLPITLILAFVVISLIGVSRKEYQALYTQCINTPPGEYMKQTEIALLTLQEQLLLQAVRDVFETKAGDLGLVHYEASLPSPDQILEQTLPGDFVATTQRLFELAGTAKRRGDLEATMRRLALAQYAELSRQQSALHPDFGEASMERLQQLALVNRTKLDKAVAGEIDALVRKAADPQVALIGKWIQSERATTVSGEEIRKAWSEFVIAPPADRQSKSNYFVNLKVLALQQALTRLHAPLLEESVNAVL